MKQPPKRKHDEVMLESYGKYCETVHISGICSLMWQRYNLHSGKHTDARWTVPSPHLHPSIAARQCISHPKLLPFLLFPHTWQPNCVCLKRGLNVTPSSMDSQLDNNPACDLFFFSTLRFQSIPQMTDWTCGWRGTEKQTEAVKGYEATPLRNPKCISLHLSVSQPWEELTLVLSRDAVGWALANIAQNDTCLMEYLTRAFIKCCFSWFLSYTVCTVRVAGSKGINDICTTVSQSLDYKMPPVNTVSTILLNSIIKGLFICPTMF